MEKLVETRRDSGVLTRISARSIHEGHFALRFYLEDHVEVGRVNYDNGLLQIGLVRKIPEAMKPRKIEIASDNPPSKPKSLSAALGKAVLG